MVVVLVLVPIGGNSILAAAVDEIQGQVESTESEGQIPTEVQTDVLDEGEKEEPTKESEEELNQDSQGQPVEDVKEETTGETKVESDVEQSGAEDEIGEQSAENVEQLPEMSNALAEPIADDTANMKFVFPKEQMDPGATYGARIVIARFTHGINIAPIGGETYDLTFYYPDGRVVDKGYVFKPVQNPVNWLTELTCDIEDIPAGTTIVVNDITVSNPAAGYDSTNGGIAIISSNHAMQIVFDNQPANPRELENGENVFTASLIHTGDGDVAQMITQDTYVGNGGLYTLEYLLTNYNAVSLDNIEASHIVGPIIAQGAAIRAKNKVDSNEGEWGGYLVASDYSKGISSYVGVLEAALGTKDSTALKLGYDFDLKYTEGFTTPPTFYTGEEDFAGNKIGLQIMSIYNEDKYMVELNDGETFLSPNNTGISTTRQNQKFINFDSLKNALIQESKDLVNNGTIEGPTDVKIITADQIVGGVLNVEAGTSVIIEDASTLVTVNLVFPEGYDYYTDPYAKPTTISIVDDEINPVIHNNIKYSRFPNTLINNKELAGVQGENGEFGEMGSKIIWNVPNIVTDPVTKDNRLTMHKSGTIVGHIVAPQADFCVADVGEKGEGDGSMLGGNLNGAIIAANIESGVIEVHMFPYFGDDEPSKEEVSTVIKGLKTFTNGDIAENSFEFKMDYVGEDKGGYTSDFTLSATSSENGKFQFHAMKFTEAGIYEFQVSEVIPTDYPLTNVTYDKSKYKVVITVTDGSAEDDMALSVVITKTHGKDGVVLETEESVNDIVFDNVAENNIVIRHTFYKENESGTRLEGAKFTITEVTAEDDMTPVEDGYLAEVESDEKGIIDITNLKGDTYYQMVETEAPEGYVTPEGYWVLHVDEYGNVKVTKVGDDIEDVEHNVIKNAKKTYKPMDITLQKVDNINTNIYLNGAKFTVEKIVSFTNHTVVVNGYSKEFTSGDIDKDGKFIIDGLIEHYFYKLTETAAPEGYVLSSNYWVIEVLPNAKEYKITEFTSDGVEVEEVEDSMIRNTKAPFILPETGGMGIWWSYVIGIVLMSYSFLYYTIKSTRIKSKRSKS